MNKRKQQEKRQHRRHVLPLPLRLRVTGLSLFGMSGFDLPVRAIREQIVSAIDLIVQQTRLHGGKRKITQICEVEGFEGDQVKMKTLFSYSLSTDSFVNH